MSEDEETERYIQISDLIDQIVELVAHVGRDNPEFAAAALAGALAKIVHGCWSPKDRSMIINYYADETRRMCLQDVRIH